MSAKRMMAPSQLEAALDEFMADILEQENGKDALIMAATILNERWCEALIEGDKVEMYNVRWMTDKLHQFGATHGTKLGQF